MSRRSGSRNDRMLPRSARRSASKRAPGKLIAVIVAAAVILVGAIVFLSVSWANPSPATTAMQSSTDDVAAKGSPDAKVTIVEYSDFQCPYCAQFAQTSGRRIDEQYVATGKVRFLYRNRAFIGPESQWAAEAALCAGDQGQFWQYHDKIFASQAGENKGAFSKDNLKRFGTQLGLDANAFNSCLDSGKYSSRVREETAESDRRAIRGTPFFFVGAQRVEGNQPFDKFREAIESELRRVQ